MSSVLLKILKASIPFALIFLLTAPTFAQLSLRRAIDYDGDGKADPTVFRPSNSSWYALRSGGGFTIQQFGVANTDTPCPGDYDGDGKGDVCVWRDTDGTFYVLRSSNGTILIQSWGVTGDEPIARTWDNNAVTDFAVARRSNGLLYWYTLNSGGGIDVTQFGAASDFAVPMDYDGDGRFDKAVQRPTASNGPSTVYILKSGTPTNNVEIVQYGLSNDFFVPGDYDGDGKSDLAIARESGGNLVWVIRNSTNNTFTIASFGTSATDFLVQNDYDGDGKTDIAVWRDTNGAFYIQQSQAGFRVAQWGAPSDFPVASYDTH